MDRRTFLKTTTAAAAASTATVGATQAAEEVDEAAIAAPAVASHHIELQIAATPELADAARALTRDITMASDGRIVIEVTDADVGAGVVDVLGSGAVDGAFGVLPELFVAPSLALFSGLPGNLALSPEQQLAWYDAGGGAMHLEHAVEPYGFTAMIAGHSGATTGLWADRELADLSLFARAQFTTTGFGAAIAERIAAAYGVSKASADAGAINLAELARAPMEAYLELAPEQRRVWYRDSLHAEGFAAALVLSHTGWDRLSAGDRMFVATLARAAAHADVSRVRVSDRLVAPAVMASLPVRVETLPNEITFAIQHTAADVVQEEMTRDGRLRPAFEAYAAFYKGMMGVPLPEGRQRSPAAV